MTLSGSPQTPQSIITLTNVGYCTLLTANTSFPSTNTAILASSALNPQRYTVCYSTDGVNFVVQEIPLYVVGALSSNSLTELSPEMAETGTKPTLSTTSHVETGSAQIGFTLTDCTSPVGITNVTSTSFQLAQAVVTPGVYDICLSFGSNFVLQTGLSFSKSSLLGLIAVE